MRWQTSIQHMDECEVLYKLPRTEGSLVRDPNLLIVMPSFEQTAQHVSTTREICNLMHVEAEGALSSMGRPDIFLSI